jgi:predicted Zn finger-like uncharacterized protein
LIVTCPACRSRYRVDAAELARPAGRTVRCTACGHLWHHPPPVAERGPREPAPSPEPAPLEAPSRADAVVPVAPPHRQPWRRIGLPVLVLLIVFAALAALYAFR